MRRKDLNLKKKEAWLKSACVCVQGAVKNGVQVINSGPHFFK